MVRPQGSIKRETFSVRLIPNLMKQLKHIGVDEKKTTSQLVEEAIDLLLKKYNVSRN